jgi:hypothetical protein
VRRGRRIPIDLHAGIELTLGAALVLVPFLVGLGPAAAAVSVTVGVLAIGLALTASEPGARGSLPLSAHAAYDWGLGVSLLGAGAVFGLLDGAGSLAFFFLAGGLELALVAATRYSPRTA